MVTNRNERDAAPVVPEFKLAGAGDMGNKADGKKVAGSCRAGNEGARTACDIKTKGKTQEDGYSRAGNPSSNAGEHFSSQRFTSLHTTLANLRMPTGQQILTGNPFRPAKTATDRAGSIVA